jgi:hypothetical protein
LKQESDPVAIALMCGHLHRAMNITMNELGQFLGSQGGWWKDYCTKQGHRHRRLVDSLIKVGTEVMGTMWAMEST